MTRKDLETFVIENRTVTQILDEHTTNDLGILKTLPFHFDDFGLRDPGRIPDFENRWKIDPYL